MLACPLGSTKMTAVERAINLIKQFEGIPDGDPTTVNLDPYLDPIGIWTIGWGHVVRDAKGNPIKGKANRKLAFSIYDGGITKTAAEILLQDDLRSFAVEIAKRVKVHLTDGQWAALMSFTFNVGVGNLAKSTLLRLINKGDFGNAVREFAKWNKADGKVLKGLVRRRAAEADEWVS